MIIDTTEVFRLTDIVSATKSSNFDKGLGPAALKGKSCKLTLTYATGSPMKSKMCSIRGECLIT